MQFNSLLFPGPGMNIPTNMEHVLYIPRGRLPNPDQFKEEKIGKTAAGSKRASSGIFGCMSSS